MRSMGEGQTPYVNYEDLVNPDPQDFPTPVMRVRSAEKELMLANEEMESPERRVGSDGTCGSACWSCWRFLCCCFWGTDHVSRLISLNRNMKVQWRYPRNVVINTKYTFITFVPQVLYEQFRYFFNMYFLLVALSQIFPPLRIGLLFTYVAPLVFVLAVTMGKEAFDDIKRYRTDQQVNSQIYTRLLPGGATEFVRSDQIRVGHIIQIETNQRVPADIALLRTSEQSGVVFARTDQLDGETDWKLRVALPPTQKLPSDEALTRCAADLYVAKPCKDIYGFVGTFNLYDEAYEGGMIQEPVGLENTMWASTVLASGTACGVVVHTGCETRSAMNISKATTKSATVDLQVNGLAKLLFLLVGVSALVMVAVPFLQRSLQICAFVNSDLKSQCFSEDLPERLLQGLLDYACFVLLFSQIIPISLRVALDMAKLVYKVQMQSDPKLPGLQVRSSTLPEELGGIRYLLTDKTGTLTRNEMIFRKLHLGFSCISETSLPETRAALLQVCASQSEQRSSAKEEVNGDLSDDIELPTLPADALLLPRASVSCGPLPPRHISSAPPAAGGSTKLRSSSSQKGASSSLLSSTKELARSLTRELRLTSGTSSAPSSSKEPRLLDPSPPAVRNHDPPSPELPQLPDLPELEAAASSQPAAPPPAAPPPAALPPAAPPPSTPPPSPPAADSERAPPPASAADAPSSAAPSAARSANPPRPARHACSSAATAADAFAAAGVHAPVAAAATPQRTNSSGYRYRELSSASPYATLSTPRGVISAGGVTQVEPAILEALLGISLCHNVSPVHGGIKAAELEQQPFANATAATAAAASTDAEAPPPPAADVDVSQLKFQGASPDELALVQFAARCGLVLHARTPSMITLKEPTGRLRRYALLHEMPFSSELKRMGVLLRELDTREIFFYVKGADAVMTERIARSDWLEEEVGNLAREGLRTLVVAVKRLTEQQYEHFAAKLHEARLVKSGRSQAVRSVLELLQEDMHLLCVTAVEDKLQANVRTTLEMLRDANVRTWMLTGDKLETAQIIAQNASLVTRYQTFYYISGRFAAEVRQQLNGYPQGSVNSPCLILDGESLAICVKSHQRLFMEVACAAPTVICCRCSPTQKAEIVRLIRQHTHCVTAAIGDGGNDVGMIHAAHVGIGVEGREGMQASLAADFSITQFSHLARLVLWHGRNCYMRSATLSQFVIHRGLIISFIQLFFSALFYFRPIPLYNGILVLGYATVFTTGPVFSLVLDEDVSEMNALKFPELYRELQKRRYLSLKTFFIWTWKALYQGGVIMLGGIYLFESRFIHVVGITFTSLILTENLMVAVEVKRWHPLMLLAQVLTLLVYIACIVALSSPNLIEADFDITFILSMNFAWRAAALTAASTVPIWVGKITSQFCAPRVATKLS